MQILRASVSEDEGVTGDTEINYGFKDRARKVKLTMMEESGGRRKKKEGRRK